MNDNYEYTIDTDLPDALHLGFNDEYVTHLVNEHECKLIPVVEMDDIIKNCNAIGSYFFDTATMKAWDSTTYDTVWGCRYFMTRDAWDLSAGTYLFSIRSIHMRYWVDEEGAFNEGVSIKLVAMFESKSEAVMLGSLLQQELSLHDALADMGKVFTPNSEHDVPKYWNGESVSF